MSIVHVNIQSPRAAETKDGSEGAPLRGIGAAARLAGPGDTVVIHPGIYRERVSPERGGTAEAPVVYRAAQKGTVFLRGSDLIEAEWHTVAGYSTLLALPLSRVPKGAEAYGGVCDPTRYGDFNPWWLQYNRKMPARPLEASLEDLRGRVADFQKKIAQSDGSGTELVNWKQKLEALTVELEQRSDPKNPRLFTTLGQVFDHGLPLHEVEYVMEAAAIPGTWLVSPDGQELWVHFPEQPGRPGLRKVELSTRHTVFAPRTRGLGHIHLLDLVIEHGCNYFPTWGDTGWGQAGLVSTRGGHHWTIRGCVIRHAKAIGMDCGTEGGEENAEDGPPMANAGPHHRGLRATTAGYHEIEDNDISDNGHCGICGIGHHGTRLRFNRIERNNALGLTAPWWEFGGVKFHHCFDALIEGNIVRDNEAHGIWLDNQFQGTRVTRNLIVNNLWSGINLEYGRGPCLVDHNVIALTRHGDGIYGHDCAEMTIAHNLIYGNAGFGVWLAYCTSRVPVADACSDHRIVNNMILGNKIGAVSLPLEWAGAKNNRSEHNLLMGSGQTLDEGSGPFLPLFQINNKSHCAQFEPIC
ncbi:MAG: right-handed parallel beta-helix repeat-containing protein, partial [Verrucomicrobiia bacterium]